MKWIIYILVTAIVTIWYLNWLNMDLRTQDTLDENVYQGVPLSVDNYNPQKSIDGKELQNASRTRW